MNCRRLEQLLSNDLEGRLPARAAGEVRAHLGACATCRRLRDELLEVGADLRALAEPIPPPEVERRAVVRWIAEQTGAPPSWWRRQFSRLAHPPAWRGPLGFSAAVAALLLAVLGLTLVRWHRGPAIGPPPLRIAAGPHADSGTPASHPAPRPLAPEVGRHRAGTPGVPLSAPSESTPTHGSPRADDRRERSRSLPPPFLRSRRRPPTVGDLADMNREPASAARQGATRSRDELDQIEATVRRNVRVGDARGPAPGAVRFAAKARLPRVQVPFPRLASASDRQTAQAVESYRREAAIVDARLARAVTVQQKATALSDLCERLRGDTGIALAAGQSVADEKVTLFCEKLPLRDVMRQLSRPFGYTWVRTGTEGEYRYELMQDLRSQLLEEELRNRDRNEALLALDREVERYRPYLKLSPPEAMARARTAPPDQKKLLETFGRYGWGAIQIYFRLSPQDLTAMRAGQRIAFSAEPEPGERLLPPDLEQGVLQCLIDHLLVRRQDGRYGLRLRQDAPEGLPLRAVPDMRAQVEVGISQSELGQFALTGASGFFGLGLSNWAFRGPWAVGMSPSAVEPDNADANARLARNPALRLRVTVLPQPSRGSDPSLGGGRSTPGRSSWRHAGGTPTLPGGDEQLPLSVSGRGQGGGVNSLGGAGGGVNKVTTAEVLEAVHQATRRPIVADYYTRLYPAGAVTVRNQPLFDALNHVADAMRLRWNREGSWLRFRSASFYDDRLKEVPNRLLAGWAASRREHGVLTVDDLVEIAQLSDAQLDAGEMAEGAREYLGLAEWDLARSSKRRPHLRYLAGFTPAQRREAMNASGLAFTKMSLAQQQGFISLGLSTTGRPLESLEDLAGATLRVDYTVPGWFQWRVRGPYWLRWVVALERDRRALRPPVLERTREAALQALRQVDPRVREAVVQAALRADAGAEMAPLDDEAQIVPTRLDLAILYLPDSANKRSIHVVWGESDSVYRTW